MPACSDDTDRTQAIQLKFLSPTWVRHIDALVGQKQAENGGYFKLEADFQGRSKPKFYDIIQRFLSYTGKA